MKLFWNIHQENPELWRQWLAWKPPVALVFRNGGLACRMQAARPDATVIGREWPDGNWREIKLCHNLDPRGWAQRLAMNYPNPRVVLYSANEYHERDIVAGTLEFLDECDRLGRRACVLNAGPGCPELEHWEYLWPIVEAVSGTHHLLGLHEYFDHHDPRYGWPCLPHQLEEWVARGGWGWYVGRYRRLFALCDELGIQRPTVTMGEHGADSLADDYHGWRCDETHHVCMTEEEYAEALTWCDRHVYGPDPDVLGPTVFSFGDCGGWQRFNVDGAYALFDRLEAYAYSVPPEPTPEPGPEPGDDKPMGEWTADKVRAAGSGNTNVRPFPTTDNRPIATVGYEWVNIEARFENLVTADGYEWVELRGGVNGWAVKRLLEFESDGAPEPEPTPDPEPDPAPTPDPSDLEERIAALEEHLASLESVLRSATESLASAVPYLKDGIAHLEQATQYILLVEQPAESEAASAEYLDALAAESEERWGEGG